MTAQPVIVGVDTMVLVWACTSDGERFDRERCEVLFSELQSRGATIVAPSIAVSEVLFPLDERARPKLLAEMSAGFMIAPFDDRCALLGAQLTSMILARRRGAQQREKARRLVKIDAMIIATAKAHGATEFYSGDAECRAMAAMIGLAAKDLPTHHEEFWPETARDGASIISRQRAPAKQGTPRRRRRRAGSASTGGT